MNMVGNQFRNYKPKSDLLWNFSCPLCGDSTSDKLAARGYTYRIPHADHLNVKCHNCGYSQTFSVFLKEISQTLYDEYLLENYQSNTHRSRAYKTPSIILPEPVELSDAILDGLTRLDTCSIDHPAIKYLIKRKIPRKHWGRLYFCPKFKAYTNGITPKFSSLAFDHPRMIIPYFTNAGKVFAFQGRAYGDETPKYFTIKVDETQEKVYGLDIVDYTKRIYVVEGPIDSLFLPNGIAVSGASFDTPTIRALSTNATLVMDNEPRNKDIVNQLSKYIDAGYSVCIWDNATTEKDINDMILSGISQKALVSKINKNTFSGLEARLKFNEWRKI